MCRTRSRSALVLLALACGLSPVTASGEEEDQLLGRSALVAAERAQAAEPFAMALVLRSNADETATVSCKIEIGERILLAGLPAESLARFDQSGRKLRWQGELPPRGEVRVDFSVIAPDWMGRSGLEVRASASRLGTPLGIFRNATVQLLEAQRRSRPSGLRVGPVIVGSSEGVLLATLAASIWIGLRLRRSHPRIAAPAALGAWTVMVAVGLLLVDGARTLVRDVRILTQGQPVQAKVLDAAAVYEPPAAGASGAVRAPRSSGSYAPLAALRYDVDGRPVVGLGFWSESHIFVGHRAARLAARFTSGSTTTCWVDPRGGRSFVLIRTPGMRHSLFLSLVALAGGSVLFGLRVRQSLRGRDPVPAV